MKKTPSNGNYRSAADSQEPGTAKKGVTYESALREEGIDERFVARKLKDLLWAQGRRWNPKKGAWEKFEDYVIQLAALREVAKISAIYAEDSDDAHAPIRLDISAIPHCRERALPDGEDSIATPAGYGRERRERWKETGV